MGVIAYDLTDAFCRCDAPRTVAAISDMQLPFADFISKWMSGRSASVFWGGSYSPSVPLEVGTPQGSVLGPLLWNIWFQDALQTIANVLHAGETSTGARTRIWAYADDLTIAVAHHDPSIVEAMLSAASQALSTWTDEHRIALSSKTTYVGDAVRHAARAAVVLRDYTVPGNDASHGAHLGPPVDIPPYGQRHRRPL